MNTPGTHNRAYRVIMKMLMTVIIFLLITIAVAAGYLWQKNKYEDLSQKNEDLISRNNELQNEIKQLEQQDQTINTSYTSQKGVKLNVYTPISDTTITRPLKIVGEVPGNWSFEASFPVLLKDDQGKVIAQQPATLQGDWMTEDLVPFIATLDFSQPAGTTGTLVLQKDNPSGLAENDDSVSIPIKF